MVKDVIIQLNVCEIYLLLDFIELMSSLQEKKDMAEYRLIRV